MYKLIRLNINGHGRVCHTCKLHKQRERRKLGNNWDCAKYEKTLNGFLMRMYRNMQSRVEGVQKAKAHLYAGKELLPREDFYAFAKNSVEFAELFKEYEDSGYDRKLAPTVDRVDSSIGYVLSNMEWVTHSENSRRGSLSQARQNRNKPINN